MRIPYWSWSSSFSVWITAVCPRPPKLSMPSAFLNPSSTPSDLIRASTGDNFSKASGCSIVASGISAKSIFVPAGTLRPAFSAISIAE